MARLLAGDTLSFAESLHRRIRRLEETGAIVRMQAVYRGRKARSRVVHSVRSAFEAICAELEAPFAEKDGTASGMVLALYGVDGHDVSGVV